MKLAQSPSTIRRKTRQNVRKKSSPKNPSWLRTTFTGANWYKVRYQAVAGLFAMLWVLLWARAVYLQIIIGSDLRTLSARQHNITQLVESKRGNIYDRNGQILARSVEVRSVYAHPQEISDPVYAAKVLAPILKLTEKQVLKKLQQERSFVWLSRKINDAAALAVRESGIAGIGLSKEYERVYPYKHLAGQLLGFVGLDNEGLEGVERAFNATLTGTSRKQVVPRDIAGRALYSTDDTETEGSDIELTLDVQVQFIAEEVIAEAVEAYDAKWGGVLIADPKTGDILAWAQYPFFNPNSFRTYDPAIYRNRLANDALEPGSTFKPLIVAVALEEQIINTKTEFFCEEGVWQIDHIKIGKDRRPFTIGDDGRAYKNLNPEEILVHSSNIGMAKIAQAIGSQKLKKYLGDLGFGKPTGIGINESRGILRRLRDWSEADLLSTGFGQSISTTAVQMLQAYNILVNDGERVSLNLIKNKSEYNPYVSEQNIFSRKNSREVLRMMESVVDGNGTGKRARIEGVRVAGKTGTAQKAAKNNTVGYGEDRMASFIGIIPADNPRYLIITIIDEPKTKVYGGIIAAPVFQKIAVRTMAYSGDLPGVVFAQETDAKINGRKAARRQKHVKIKKGFVPNVKNLSLRGAMEAFLKLGIIPRVEGEGTRIVHQEPSAGTPIYSALTDEKKSQIKKENEKKNSKNKTATPNTTDTPSTTGAKVATGTKGATDAKGNKAQEKPTEIKKPQTFTLYLSMPKPKLQKVTGANDGTGTNGANTISKNTAAIQNNITANNTKPAKQEGVKP